VAEGLISQPLLALLVALVGVVLAGDLDCYSCEGCSGDGGDLYVQGSSDNPTQVLNYMYSSTQDLKFCDGGDNTDINYNDTRTFDDDLTVRWSAFNEHCFCGPDSDITLQSGCWILTTPDRATLYVQQFTCGTDPRSGQNLIGSRMQWGYNGDSSLLSDGFNQTFADGTQAVAE